MTQEGLRVGQRRARRRRDARDVYQLACRRRLCKWKTYVERLERSAIIHLVKLLRIDGVAELEKNKVVFEVDMTALVGDAPNNSHVLDRFQGRLDKVQ